MGSYFCDLENKVREEKIERSINYEQSKHTGNIGHKTQNTDNIAFSQKCWFRDLHEEYVHLYGVKCLWNV